MLEINVILILLSCSNDCALYLVEQLLMTDLSKVWELIKGCVRSIYPRSSYMQGYYHNIVVDTKTYFYILNYGNDIEQPMTIFLFIYVSC